MIYYLLNYVGEFLVVIVGFDLEGIIVVKGLGVY